MVTSLSLLFLNKLTYLYERIVHKVGNKKNYIFVLNETSYKSIL